MIAMPPWVELPRRPAELPAATVPRPDAAGSRMITIDRRARRLVDGHVRDLAGRLGPRDVLVLNDAATLPASLRTRTKEGDVVEVRLLAHAGGACWSAVLFGAGDFRTPTEHRLPPPGLEADARLSTAGGATLVVERVDPTHARLVEVRFDREGAAMWATIYREARPVQYAYMPRPANAGDLQTPWATRPWSVEMPSAGRPITRELVERLRARGVAIAWLTHAAGLSSTGDAALDAALPLPERTDLPAATVAAIEAARAASGRVVAVGTTVVRALEGRAAAGGGALAPGDAVTDLRIGPTYCPRVVDAILSNVHTPGESHFELLTAFADRALLERAMGHAARVGYLAHELGDFCLVW